MDDDLDEAQAEREARVCLARLNSASTEIDVCCDGVIGAWERALRLNPEAREITYQGVLDEARAASLTVVTAGDERWPGGFDELSVHAPWVAAIWTAGRPLELAAPVTITGARAATAYGQQVASDLANGLARQGHTIVAGLSHGVDAAALAGALAADGPAPVAILASGFSLDGDASLQGQEHLVPVLLERGTILTELPPEARPNRWTVHNRSRLLAALGVAVVVVEASTRSSSRLVARWARDLPRTLCAVPGPVTSVHSQLPHELIHSGRAKLVIDAKDVIDAMKTPATKPEEIEVQW